jgi:flagellar basal body-associated protein FliL
VAWRKAAKSTTEVSQKSLFINKLTYGLRGVQSMKLAIRTLIVVLALTGAVATTQVSSASTQNKVTVARTSMIPVPMCAPDDPNACGMAQGR